MDNKIYELVLYSREIYNKNIPDVEHVLSTSISEEVAIREMNRYRDDFCELGKLEVEHHKLDDMIDSEVRGSEKYKELVDLYFSTSSPNFQARWKLWPDLINVSHYASEYFIQKHFISKMKIREVELVKGKNTEKFVNQLLLIVDNRYNDVGEVNHMILRTTDNDFIKAEHNRYNTAIEEVSSIYVDYEEYKDSCRDWESPEESPYYNPEYKNETYESINEQSKQKLRELIPDLEYLLNPIQHHRAEMQYASYLILKSVEIIRE